MSRRDVQHRRVVMDNHGTQTAYDNPVSAAAELGITAQSIYQKISSGRPDKYGRFFFYEGEPRKERARLGQDGRRPIAVVAVSDRGQKVGLRSLYQAQLLIGAPKSAVRRMLKRKTREYGWRLYGGKMDRDGNISIDTELYSLNELPLSPAAIRNCSQGLSGPELSDRCVYGFVDAEFGPAVCPVCNQVMAMTPDRYCQHFNHCLKGRTWRILLGGRLEVSLDVDPDPVVHKFSLATR